MYHNLVISGGSTKTIAVLGCLQYLQEQKVLTNIKSYIGTSAGAILSFFLVLGYSIDEIKQFLIVDIFEKGLHTLTMDEITNLTFLDTFGIDSGNNALIIFSNILFKKSGLKDISFRDLGKMTGKNLVVCVANITKGCSEHMCIDTEPEMSVLKAIRMSISLPFIFTPVSYKDCLYVDGGIYETLPTRYVLSSQKHPLKETLAIRTKVSKKEKTVQNFIDYTRLLFSSLVTKLNDCQDVDTNKVCLVDVEFEDIDMTSFSYNNMTFQLSQDIIAQFIEKGYGCCQKQFRQHVLEGT